MGDAKTTLQCLGNCDASFDIACLQKALKPDMFSKWFRKIQMAEIGEVIALSYQINTHFPGFYICPKRPIFILVRVFCIFHIIQIHFTN